MLVSQKNLNGLSRCCSFYYSSFSRRSSYAHLVLNLYLAHPIFDVTLKNDSTIPGSPTIHRHHAEVFGRQQVVPQVPHALKPAKHSLRTNSNDAIQLHLNTSTLSSGMFSFNILSFISCCFFCRFLFHYAFILLKVILLFIVLVILRGC